MSSLLAEGQINGIPLIQQNRFVHCILNRPIDLQKLVRDAVKKPNAVTTVMGCFSSSSAKKLQCVTEISMTTYCQIISYFSAADRSGSDPPFRKMMTNGPPFFPYYLALLKSDGALKNRLGETTVATLCLPVLS